MPPPNLIVDLNSISENSMINQKLLVGLMTLMAIGLCGAENADAANLENANRAFGDGSTKNIPNQTKFEVKLERFADIQVLRYQIPGFEELSLKQKELLYYLSQAAYSGRDMMYDQNFKYNLRIRRTIEAVVKHYKGDRNSDEFKKFMIYAQQQWFANGIHHHYSTLKFQPLFSKVFFNKMVSSVAKSGDLPLNKGETYAQLISELGEIIFNPNNAPKKVDTSKGVDKVAASAVNFYEGVNEEEVRAFYNKRISKNDATPISHGLNSKLIKNSDGKLVEKVWKIGGMYTESLEQVVYWLEKAIKVAENEKQAKALNLLVQYYHSGNLKDFDDYSIAWIEDTQSRIDVINGYIEVYNDPIAYRGSFESVVSFRDDATSKRISAIGDQAQWFEDHSPIMNEHKRKEVKGILGKAIIVVAESGDASPSTPIGINLPNANWIRANHGSKSVSLSNIVDAYDTLPKKSLEEYAWSEEEIALERKYGSVASHLHTDMHEVIGHASGKINKGVGTPKETLKQYSSTSEEARADLVGLYFLMDPKLVELGLSPSLDVGKSAYNRYIRNGIMSQLTRIKPGELIEEAHMRNRAMIARWAFSEGKKDNVIERKIRDGKTYFVVNDYQKLRKIFAMQLRELQRVKSEGDFKRIEYLVETYGTQVDEKLHKEVLARFKKLNVAPYRGFANPVLVPVKKNGKIIDVKIEYPKSFVDQMMYYAENYSFLPNVN
jgi:dipeptidyl-peptidase III